MLFIISMSMAMERMNKCFDAFLRPGTNQKVVTQGSEESDNILKNRLSV